MVEIFRPRLLHHVSLRSTSSYLYACCLSLCFIITTPDLCYTEAPSVIGLNEIQEPVQTTVIHVGVMDLTPLGIADHEAKAISDRLRHYLNEQIQFQVMERNEMASLMSEIGFSETGACDSDECVVEFGKILNVEKMVAGNVSQVGSSFSISVRMIDVATSAIEGTTFQDMDSIDEILRIGTELVAKQLSGEDVGLSERAQRNIAQPEETASGLVEVTSNPPASIMVDGQRVGSSPATLRLPAGMHEIKLENRGYETYTENVQILTKQTSVISVNLNPLLGNIRVLTTPDSALVLIDGEPKGRAPRIIPLSPGNYLMELQLVGYNDYFRRVFVTAGQTASITARLTEIVTGYVNIETTPIGASIYMSGRELGTTPGRLRLPVGSHRIELRKNGYETQNVTITIRSGITEKVTRNLLRIGRATLGLRTSRQGAKVYVDGNLYSRVAPIDSMAIRPGGHLIVIAAPGYNLWRRSISLSDGSHKDLQIVLKPKSRIAAGFLSTILPGGGQMYYGRGGKGFLLLLLHAGAAAYGYSEFNAYTQLKEEYDTLVLQYKIETDPNQVNILGDKMEVKYLELTDKHELLKNIAMGLGGLYLINILDALILRPHLPSSISLPSNQDVKLGVRSTNGALALSVCVRF